MMYGVPNMKTDKVDVVQRRPAGKNFFRKLSGDGWVLFFHGNVDVEIQTPKHIAG